MYYAKVTVNVHPKENNILHSNQSKLIYWIFQGLIMHKKSHQPKCR